MTRPQPPRPFRTLTPAEAVLCFALTDLLVLRATGAADGSEIWTDFPTLVSEVFQRMEHEGPLTPALKTRIRAHVQSALSRLEAEGVLSRQPGAGHIPTQWAFTDSGIDRVVITSAALSALNSQPC